MGYDFVRPDGQPCLETKEFDLVRNMLIAVVEERYKDAGNEIILFYSLSTSHDSDVIIHVPISIFFSVEYISFVVVHGLNQIKTV